MRVELFSLDGRSVSSYSGSRANLAQLEMDQMGGNDKTVGEILAAAAVRSAELALQLPARPTSADIQKVLSTSFIDGARLGLRTASNNILDRTPS